MNKRLKISIPSPCHENWETMTPTKKGRFCASCQIKVYDFTSMPDKEIVSILQNDKYVCGKLTNEQLYKGLQTQREKSYINIAASAAALSLLTINFNEAVAQQSVPAEQTSNYSRAILHGKVRIAETQQIEGIIYDNMNIPLQHVTVTDTITKKSAVTDAEGKFSLVTEKGNVLEIKHKEFISDYITIKNTSSLIHHKMILETAVIGQVVYKGSFFGRMFRKVGSLFKRKD